MSWIKEAKLLFINTPFGETKNIEIEKIFKQGASYGPVKPEESRYRNFSIYRQHISNRRCRGNQEMHQKLHENKTLNKFKEN